MLMWLEEGDRHQGVAELVVQTINLSSGRWTLEELLSHSQYERLSNLTNRVCHQLYNYQKQKVSCVKPRNIVPSYDKFFFLRNLSSSLVAFFQHLPSTFYCYTSTTTSIHLLVNFFWVLHFGFQSPNPKQHVHLYQLIKVIPCMGLIFIFCCTKIPFHLQ